MLNKLHMLSGETNKKHKLVLSLPDAVPPPFQLDLIRSRPSVCLFVRNITQKDHKLFKLGIAYILGIILQVVCFGVERSKVNVRVMVRVNCTAIGLRRGFELYMSVL